MAGARSPIIQVRNIGRVFESTKKEAGVRGLFNLVFRPTRVPHQALGGVNFSVEPGEFIGLIGANGAGKTTLLKILSGLIPPTTGEARVLGFDPFDRQLGFRKQISLVMGQKAQLWWDLPALDAFELLRAIYGIAPSVYQERLKMLTTLLGVERHLSTQLRRLSLGERMKMELIGALLHWPSVIFLDEPTIGLDVLAAHRLREFLREFNRKERSTIILTSHNMEDIERLCPRILILKSGELIYDGAPWRLTRSGEHQLRVRLMEKPSLEELSRISQIPCDRIQVVSSRPTEEEEATTEDENNHPAIFFTVEQGQTVAVIQRLLEKFRIVDMGVQEQSLESVIQRLYEGGSQP